MTKNEELAAMIKRAGPHWIAGREPQVDWLGNRTKDKDLTLVIRLSVRDRDRIVRALLAN